MKVRDLIEKLTEQDPDRDVLIDCSSGSRKFGREAKDVGERMVGDEQKQPWIVVVVR